MLGAILAAASFAVDAIGSITGADAQNRAAAANRKAALQAYIENIKALNTRSVQETRAATQAKQQSSQQAQSLASSTMTAASEAGVSGVTLDSLMTEIRRKESLYSQDVDENLKSTLSQIEANKRGAQAQAESRIAAVQPVNPWLVGLQMGNSALSLVARRTAQSPPKST